MPPDNQQNPVLGIDLGTTFSCIARWTGRGTEVYRNSLGAPETQSAIYRDPETGEILVGQIAFSRGLTDPDNVVLGVKRMMDDASQKVKLGPEEFTPVELSSRILSSLYGAVVNKFPAGLFESRGTVVTVPYYFKAHQCENTRAAAEMADIQCMGILQEPIAASLSYAWQLVQEHPDREDEEVVLVFDLGGGTFDLTLFRLKQQRDKLTFEVLATGGNDRLGGMDFDKCLTEKLLEKAGLSLDGLDPKEERRARQKLLLQTIITKETLSVCKATHVSVGDIIPGRHIDMGVTQEEFEKCINQLDGNGDRIKVLGGNGEPLVDEKGKVVYKPAYLEDIREILRQLWDTVKLKPKDVDRVIRVGGSSRIACVKRLLCDIIGEEKMYGNINESECVAEGAALYAACMVDSEVFGREIEITTRTCHALGVEVTDEKFAVVIPANRKAPCESFHFFTNPADNVTSMDFNVYQGSSREVRGNTKIGTVKVSGLPPRRARELEIKVTFRVSKDQKLSVVAEYKNEDGKTVRVQNSFTMQ